MWIQQSCNATNWIQKMQQTGFSEAAMQQSGFSEAAMQQTGFSEAAMTLSFKNNLNLFLLAILLIRKQKPVIVHRLLKQNRARSSVG